MINLMQGNCLELLKTIPDGSVDLILTDPPYGTVNNIGDSDSIEHGMKNKTKWDEILDFKLMWTEVNRVLRKNGKCILFSQEPFTSNLIKSAIPNVPFSYRCAWIKDHFANSLIAKKAPVNYYEDICVFSKLHDMEDLHPLRNYLKECKVKSGMTNKQFNTLFSEFYNKKGCRDRSVLEHYWAASQFTMPTEEIYKMILQPTGFFPRSYEGLKAIDDQFKNKFASTFNLWQGKKYKSNVFEYKKDYDGYHPTQKPVALLEDLIQTYSNDGNTVLDFTMGSGSTGVAAKNTNRKFIGIELDEKYFQIAKERIENA